ncbi:hypothetical protein HUN08_07005 [Gordonia sp. X0973]|uniref:hypothetical protein n=1 Tax=Gordonia sp. X0973 TaxID=2742602 RepID=UPI000F53C005|nr:hypothetical protein [Gordonia sp. X0973]QKT06967.1 hypothetical protein HUN08_07005 [Gordonia sp. X0973]
MAPDPTTVNVSHLHDLATSARSASKAIGQAKPLNGGHDPESDARGALVARSLGDSAIALDKAIEYHAQRIAHFGDLATKSANAYEHTERNNRHRIGG